MQQQATCDVHGNDCHQGLFSRNLFVGQRIPLAGVAHQNGTIRFGRDPQTSALDVNCKAHDVDNLYVVDGSFFPSSGAVNPALTIMANALRVGDHLLERLGLASRGRSRRWHRDPHARSARRRPAALRPWRSRRQSPALADGDPPLPMTRGRRPSASPCRTWTASLDFYTGVLPFQESVRRRGRRAGATSCSTGVFGARARVVRLRLGDEQIELTEYLTPRGRPMPADVRANDRWFQHVAIIVSDMDRPTQRLRAARRRARVDRAAAAARLEPERRRHRGVLLPRSRPPFPRDPALSRRARDRPSGSSAGDATVPRASITRRSSSTTPTASLAFYRDTLGFAVAGESENYDVEQEHLNNVFGARLRITALRAAAGPGHRAARIPRATRRPAGARRSARERHRALADHSGRRFARRLLPLAGRTRIALVSPGPVDADADSLGFRSGALVRDPDGHGLRLVVR